MTTRTQTSKTPIQKSLTTNNYNIIHNMLFKTIFDAITPGTDVTIVIRKKEDGLVVSTAAKNVNVSDPAKDLIAPFVVTGTAEELDKEFASLISKPVTESTGIQTSMENFEASKKLAEKKSQAAAQEKKEQEAKQKADKTKVEKLVATADALMEKKKYAEAKKAYEQALPLAEGSIKSKIEKAIKVCKDNQQPGIFSDFDETESDVTDCSNVNQADSNETEHDEEPEISETSEEATEETEEVNALDF